MFCYALFLNYLENNVQNNSSGKILLYIPDWFYYFGVFCCTTLLLFFIILGIIHEFKRIKLIIRFRRFKKYKSEINI